MASSTISRSFKESCPCSRTMNKDIVIGTQRTEDDADRLFSTLTYTQKPTVDGKYRNETQ